MARTDETQLPQQIQELAEPLAAELEVELVDVEVKGTGNRRLVRLVAAAAAGHHVDVIAALSRKDGGALD